MSRRSVQVDSMDNTDMSNRNEVFPEILSNCQCSWIALLFWREINFTNVKVYVHPNVSLQTRQNLTESLWRPPSYFVWSWPWPWSLTAWPYNTSTSIQQCTFGNVFCNLDFRTHDLQNLISSWSYCRKYLFKVKFKSLQCFFRIYHIHNMKMKLCMKKLNRWHLDLTGLCPYCIRTV